MANYKLIRITTVAKSLEKLLENQLKFMRDHYDVIAMASDYDDLIRFGAREDIHVHCVDMTRKITPFKDLKALWQLYKFFKNERPYIVHTHTPKAGTVGMLAAKLAGVPHRLHTIAGLPLLEANGAKRLLLNMVEKATYACATHIYPNSSGLKDIILKLKFCKLEKLKVIGNGSSNGINTEHFNRNCLMPKDLSGLKSKLKISSSDFIFIFVGRLVGDKGINELVVAFKILCSRLANVKLLLVGEFESELDPLKSETIQEIKINDNIINVGFQPDVRPYLAISDTLIFPSYREGFPNVVMQAGAMDLPCIVTDINGCNEIIEEGVNGTIIEVKSSHAILLAMDRMMNDNSWRRELQKNARARIVARYEQRIVWEALLAEYKKLSDFV
jgi:glycosyltransferase involved in cell wall biosynthesis